MHGYYVYALWGMKDDMGTDTTRYSVWYTWWHGGLCIMF